jgi:phosphoribosyl 1,2-cyclic phosphodiesterase
LKIEAIMKVKFWGVRGSIPVAGRQTVRYGGNSSCVELRLSNGELIIFDAGTGIRLLGRQLLKDKKPLRFHLLLSHGHMDHVHGFPFFGPAYVKTCHITLAGCPRGGKKVQDMVRRQMGDMYFPVEYDGLPAKMEQIIYCKDDVLRIGNARVHTRETNHPGEGIAFRVHEKGKTIVYMTDNELNASRPNAFPFGEFVDFVKGVDILIHDIQYSPYEYRKYTKGWGHSTYEDSARLAVEGKVKELVIFHHDPDHDDNRVEWMVEKTKETIRKMGGRGVACTVAREGMSLKV